MSAAKPLTGDEWNRVADFIRATLSHAEALTRCHRYEEAAASLDGLRRLAATIRREAGTLGYMPEILLAAERAAIERAS